MTEQPASYPAEWSTGKKPNLDGMLKYLIMIRADGDPDETTYKKVGKDGRNKYTKKSGGDESLAWTKIKKMPIEECRKQILAYLDELSPDEQCDGVTFNRICVDLWRRTADVLHESNQEEAMWQLVEERQLAHTLDAPILWRRARLDEQIDASGTQTGRLPSKPEPSTDEPGEPIMTAVDFEELEHRVLATFPKLKEWRDLTMTMFAKCVDERVHVTFDKARQPHVMGDPGDGASSEPLVAVDAVVEAASADFVQLDVEMLWMEPDPTDKDADGLDAIPVEGVQLIVQASVCTSMQLLEDDEDDDGGGSDDELDDEDEPEEPPVRQKKAARGRPKLRAVAIG